MVKCVTGVLFSILFANLKDKRSQALLQFGWLHCLYWRNISACLSSIIAPLFPNLHTVVGVFKGLLWDTSIAKLFDFVVGFRWCKLCVDAAGSRGGGAGRFCGNYICRGGTRLVQDVERCRKYCVYVVVSIEPPQKDKSSSFSKSLSSMTCASFSSVTIE